MRKLLSAVVLGGALVSLGTGSAFAAPMMVTFHAAPGAMHMLMHVTGSATITYTKGDATIKVTTDNLPAVSTFHGKYYTVWAQTGAMSTYAGVLKVTGAMAGGHYMIMDTTFTKLVISAETAMHPMHAMGTKVLIATVMHH